MQGNDLGTWESKRILLVLEDTCCHITYHKKQRLLPGGKTVEPDEVEDWDWAITTIKTIQRYSFNSVPVEIITFCGQEIADMAAEWFQRYDVDVSSVEHYDFARFCRSLTWRRNNIQEIIDTDSNRLERYGQLGRQVLYDSGF